MLKETPNHIEVPRPGAANFPNVEPKKEKVEPGQSGRSYACTACRCGAMGGGGVKRR